jgi:transcription antitermination protein NusB
MNATIQNSSNNARRLARLAAVQALYQIVLEPKPVAQVIGEFTAHPPSLQESGGGSTPSDIDNTLFTAIVNGVATHGEELDTMIAGACDNKSSVERLEILLRAILRAGVYELHHQTSIPAGVIINDYVDVTHAFFNGKEPGLVNGILDKLAKNLRAA